MNFLSEEAVFGQKKLRTVRRIVKNLIYFRLLLINGQRYFKNSNRFLFRRQKEIFLHKKCIKK
jgi:hypothetical protein